MQHRGQSQGHCDHQAGDAEGEGGCGCQTCFDVSAAATEEAASGRRPIRALDAVDYTFEDGPPDLGQVSPTERWEGLSADERQLYEERSSAETILWAEWLQQPQWVRQQAWQRQHEEERQQALQACEQQVLREQEDVWRPAWERGLAACKARLASTSVASFTIGPPASPRPRSRRKRARLDQVDLQLDPAAFLETVFNEVLMELNGAELAPVLNVCQDWRRHGDDVLRIHSWIARHVELLELMARRETDSVLVARLLAHPEEAARNVGESIYSQVFEGGRPPHLPNNWPRGVYPLQLAIELGYSEQTIRQILFAAPMTLQEMSYYRTPKFEGSAPALHVALLRVDCPAVLEMIRGAPHAGGQMVRVGDVAQCRPLHLAVARATVGLELVQALLSCHPKAVKEARVVAGAPQPALLPLQIAARSDASIEVLDVLRAAYPPERWPTDQLLRCSHGGPEEEEACARFSRPGVARGLRCERFLEAIRDGCSVEVIRTLCAANPLLAALPSDACDSFGGMALHVAAQHAAFAAVLHPLIDANPHALRYRNSNGDLPLHIACKRRVTTQGRASKVAMDAMIAVLLNAWPAAVTYSDLEYHLRSCYTAHTTPSMALKTMRVSQRLIPTVTAPSDSASRTQSRWDETSVERPFTNPQTILVVQVAATRLTTATRRAPYVILIGIRARTMSAASCPGGRWATTTTRSVTTLASSMTLMPLPFIATGRPPTMTRTKTRRTRFR